MKGLAPSGRRRLWVVAALLGLATTPVHAQGLGLGNGPDIPWLRVLGALLFCCLLGVAGAFALKHRLKQRPLTGKVPGRRVFAAGNWRQVVAAIFEIKSERQGDGKGRLHTVETLRLGNQVEVCLLECDGDKVLLVSSPHGAFVVNPPAAGNGGDL